MIEIGKLVFVLIVFMSDLNFCIKFDKFWKIIMIINHFHSFFLPVLVKKKEVMIKTCFVYTNNEFNKNHTILPESTKLILCPCLGRNLL